VFLRGVLGDRPHEPESPLCKAFCDEMINMNRRIYVAAPTLAEVIRYQGQRVPRYQSIVVVPFDDRAAEILGLHLPMARLHQSKLASGSSVSYLKYDSMIMACAIRSGAAVLVTMYSDHHPLAHLTSIRVEHPKAFRKAQLTLDEVPAVAHESLCARMERWPGAGCSRHGQRQSHLDSRPPPNMNLALDSRLNPWGGSILLQW
jgi:hypothetical protein